MTDGVEYVQHWLGVRCRGRQLHIRGTKRVGMAQLLHFWWGFPSGISSWSSCMT